MSWVSDVEAIARARRCYVLCWTFIFYFFKFLLLTESLLKLTSLIAWAFRSGPWQKVTSPHPTLDPPCTHSGSLHKCMVQQKDCQRWQLTRDKRHKRTRNNNASCVQINNWKWQLSSIHEMFESVSQSQPYTVFTDILWDDSHFKQSSYTAVPTRYTTEIQLE